MRALWKASECRVRPHRIAQTFACIFPTVIACVLRVGHLLIFAVGTQNYLLYWQPFVIKDLVADEVVLLLCALSTALWLLGSQAPTMAQVDLAERMLHFWGKHMSEWFGTLRVRFCQGSSTSCCKLCVALGLLCCALRRRHALYADLILLGDGGMTLNTHCGAARVEAASGGDLGCGFLHVCARYCCNRVCVCVCVCGVRVCNYASRRSKCLLQ